MRLRLAALVMGAFIPIFGLAVLNAFNEREGRVTGTRLVVSQLAASTAEQYRELIDGAHHMLAAAALSPLLRDPATCTALFSDLAGRFEVYRNFTMADSNGTVVCTSFRDPPQANFRGLPWFDRATTSGGFALGQFERGRLSGAPILVAALPVSEPRGVLAVSLDLSYLSQRLAEQNAPREFVITVIDSQGTIAARSADPDRWVGTRFTTDPVALAAHSAETPVERPGVDGVMRFTSARVVSVAPEARLEVVVGVQSDAVLGPVTRQLQRNILLVAVLMLLVGGIVWLSADRAFVRPLRRVMATTGALADGDLSTRTGLSGHGEVNRMAAAIDEMAAEMQKRRRNEEATALRLRQSERLESLGQLAGGMAHDFNNVLTVVLNYVDLAREDLVAVGGDATAVLPFLEEVSRAGQRAAALTGQLLTFASHEPTRPELTDINAVVAEVAAMLRRTLGEQIDLAIQAAPTLPPVVVDHGQLENVLLNLALNARDAMPDGGTLTIGTDTVRLTQSDTLGDHHPGVYVRLRVSDTGHGMSAEVQSRAFEPFFTTKPAGRGTGFGLATVYGAVAQSGGFIELQSEVGRGTTIEIYMPVTTGHALTPERSVGARVRGLGQLILLVEDDEGVRRAVEQSLVKHGYAVDAVTSGGEAREQWSSAALLLTDVVLPDGAGPELAEEWRETWPDRPVLFMSGYMERGVGPGETLLAKPFTQDELLLAVREVLGQSPTEDGQEAAATTGLPRSPGDTGGVRPGRDRSPRAARSW